ncbi:Cwc24p [Sugiyamaella lignohabitans]|uniref:Pre-mRNA-splicing factor CWC24 n=1 Tax=Sugiyamaella lignohabitans TaxID=796027 RepID=A0A167D8Z6_9ASCO|nr:Cwc24p [Sugiyamaella lignohabitans]ANB12629.1 Cwc24p [Sugiyamaella lignohabitans]
MPSLFKARKISKSTSLATKRKTIDQDDDDGHKSDSASSVAAEQKSDSLLDPQDGSDESEQSQTNEPTKIVSGQSRKRAKIGFTSSSTSTNSDKTDIGQVKHDHSHDANASNSAADEATKQSALYSDESAADNGTTSNGRLSEELGPDHTGSAIDGVYHGKVNYSSYLTKREGVSSKARFGPMKAAGNIRSTTMIDYQPDVCKDYKQTGFCGYGDTCKFLHSREDYKAGWKLDKEWEEVQNETKTKIKSSSTVSSSGSETTRSTSSAAEIPFKCVICKNDYKDPVVTQCEHYFCEPCFLKESRKKGACFICGKNTGGVAKPAKNLKQLLARRT